MADPTNPNITSIQDLWNDILAFTDTLQDHEQKARFAQYRRFIIELVMNGALLGIPENAVFIEQNRKFLKNGTGANIVIEGNGQEWVFPPGFVYACSPEELDFFLGKCVELGIAGLVQDTYSGWAFTGFKSYFWS